METIGTPITEEIRALIKKAEEKYPYEFMIEKSLIDCKRKGYFEALIDNRKESIELNSKLEKSKKALDTLILCSNFEEVKKEYSNTVDHWTNEIDEVMILLN